MSHRNNRDSQDLNIADSPAPMLETVAELTETTETEIASGRESQQQLQGGSVNSPVASAESGDIEMDIVDSSR